MNIQHSHICGDAYWLDNTPPLDGDHCERRPVIIIDDPDLPPTEALVVAVIATTTQDISDFDAVYLGSELSQPCWAVPRWLFQVERVKLTERAGRVSGPALIAIIEAVINRVYD